MIKEVFPTAPSPRSNNFRMCLISFGKTLVSKLYWYTEMIDEIMPIKDKYLTLFQKFFLPMLKTVQQKQKKAPEYTCRV